METPNNGRHARIRQWYLAWNNRDWGAVESILHRDCDIEDVVLERRMEGKANYLRYALEFVHAFPAGRIVVDRIFGTGRNGEFVAVEYRMKGTQDGTFAGFPPSKRMTEFRMCDILEFQNDLLIRCRTYMDLYGALVGLGHVTPKPSPAERAA